MPIEKPPILVVDDEEDVLLALRSLLRREYDVTTIPRAREALAMMADREFHVVVSDQRMPDMSGVEFLGAVAEQFPEVMRVMITGYADIDSVIAAVNCGHVFRYIAKPWEPAELESAIRQASEQYQVLAERRRLIRELEDANQLKTAFISVASHELNTPLTIVMGMIQLASGRNTSPAIGEYLERALNAATRLQHLLTNTFKLLQQKEFHRSLERTEVPIADLFAEIQQDLSPYLKNRLQILQCEIVPADAVIHISRTHARDVLENLLTNAIKFSPDEAVLRLRAESRGAMTLFEVIDRGIGIPVEDQPHVFEPLFSTWDMMHHSSGDYGFGKRGLGLGLAIVRKFVEMHGGTINFESTPGQGTTFRIELPTSGERHEST